MSLLKGLVMLMLAVCVLGGACATSLLVTAVNTANEPIRCWDPYSASGVIFPATWEEQAYSQLRPVVDPTISEFDVVTVTSRDADDTWTEYFAWRYPIEREQENLQCSRDSIGYQWENAALWSKSTWFWHIASILLGVLATIALAGMGLGIAAALCDEHDWPGWVDYVVCLLGLLWPLGLAAVPVVGALWVLRSLLKGALRLGLWASEF